MTGVRIAVVGGGIAGVSAAYPQVAQAAHSAVAAVVRASGGDLVRHGPRAMAAFYALWSLAVLFPLGRLLRARRRGKDARGLQFAPYEAWLERPLAEVRADLGIEPPQVAHPAGFAVANRGEQATPIKA